MEMTFVTVHTPPSVILTDVRSAFLLTVNEIVICAIGIDMVIFYAFYVDVNVCFGFIVHSAGVKPRRF